MPDPIDDLSLRWKRNPDASSTIALCEALRTAPRPGLVQQVGEVAQQKHASDVAVLVAVARMYLDSQRLSDAQAVLVAAGKVAPRDGAIYRWLGEVLLRRGDAERAEKVLERAMQLGTNDGETRLWLDRARVFKPVQAKAGTRAVAMEIAQAAPASDVPRGKMDSLGDDSTTNVLVAPNVTEDSVSDAETQVRDAPMAPPKPPLPKRRHDPETVPYPTPGADLRVALDDAMRRHSTNNGARAVPPKQDPRPPAAPPPAPSSARSTTEDKPGIPSARDVLNALSLAGVFEPAGGTLAVRWDRPVEKTRRGSTIVLTLVMMFMGGAGYGAYRLVQDQRQKKHVLAEGFLQKVESDMNASRTAFLPSIEESLGKAFELDSRSQRAALDWLHERALVGLLKGGGDVAFEDAIHRATEVGVPEAQIAFARLASFLFQGDTGGAASLMPKWDGPAANDAWYQLLAGATLERAGDARAAERYSAAARLAPELMVAEVAVVRQAAIEGDAQKAADLAKQFRTKFPDRAEGAALVSLAWARDPGRGEQPPPEVTEMVAHASEMPLSLQAVPPALLAIEAVDKHAFADAKTQVEKALTSVDGPGVAAWLGDIALDTGDEALARKAALAAVGFSAVYPPARALAARVALIGDRLDEAVKATDELDVNSPGVAAVRAAVAYERVDLGALKDALDAVSGEARQQPFLGAVTLAESVLAGKAPLSGQKILDMSDDEAPWSDLVAMDLALDLGELDTADKIAAAWKGTESNPLRALRLSRLSRYQNKLDAADTLSKTALDNGTVTTRTLEERVFVLVARNKQSEVRSLLEKFPLVLGTNRAWLSAFAQANAGKVDEARGNTATLDPPPALAPLPSRVIAALALAAMKDRRRGVDYVRELLTAGIQDPDLVAAALSLGFQKVEHPARRR
jgi:tetratricopeptide (TPR) repeat protein